MLEFDEVLFVLCIVMFLALCKSSTHQDVLIIRKSVYTGSKEIPNRRVGSLF